MLKGNYTETFLNDSTPDILGFVTAPIIELLGGAPIFYGWIMVLICAMLAMKNKEIGIMAVIGYIMATVFISQLPENLHNLLMILIGITLVVIIYKVLTKKSSH